MSTDRDTSQLNFEEAYSRLEELIHKLDVGGLTLEDALACYEEAYALVSRCNSILQQAELRLRQIEEEASEYAAADDLISKTEPYSEDEEDSDLSWNYDYRR